MSDGTADSQSFEYDFVKISSPIEQTTVRAFRRNVDEMASDGWRYVDSIQTTKATTIVVFEREATDVE